MRVNVNGISISGNIPVYIFIHDIQVATHWDAYPQELKVYIILDWQHKNKEVDCRIRQYCPIRNELAKIGGIAMKGKRIIIPFQLQKQPHSNYMGIEKMMLLAYESLYWLNMNADIEDTVKHCAT